jgi:hypothetical protein
MWITLQSAEGRTLDGCQGTAVSSTRIASAALTNASGLPPAIIGWCVGMAI